MLPGVSDGEKSDWNSMTSVPGFGSGNSFDMDHPTVAVGAANLSSSLAWHECVSFGLVR